MKCKPRNKIKLAGRVTVVNQCVLEWFQYTRIELILVHGPVVKTKAIEIAQNHLIEDFVGSNGWLDQFHTCYNITFKAVSGEAGDVTRVECSSWRASVNSVNEWYSCHDILIWMRVDCPLGFTNQVHEF